LLANDFETRLAAVRIICPMLTQMCEIVFALTDDFSNDVRTRCSRDVGPRETWLQLSTLLTPGPKMHQSKKEEGINAVVRHQQSQAKDPVTPCTNLSHGIRSISHTSIGTQEQGAHKPPAVPDSLARRYFTTVTKNHPFIVVIINVPIMMSPLLADHRLAVSQPRHPQAPTPPQPSAPYPPRP
jgi:hypothetical protein